MKKKENPVTFCTGNSYAFFEYFNYRSLPDDDIRLL